MTNQRQHIYHLKQWEKIAESLILLQARGEQSNE